MSQKNRSQLKTERTNTYKAGVPKGTTVANEYNYMENLLDSVLLKAEGEGQGNKTFSTAGTGTAYTVTDAEVTANTFLDGKTFFIIPHTDVTGAATIQFNSNPVLNLKLVGESGKADTTVNSLKANVAYLATKEVGVSELYIREAGSGEGLKTMSAVDGSGGSGASYDITDASLVSEAQLATIGFLIKFDSSPDPALLITILPNNLLIIDIYKVSSSGPIPIIKGDVVSDIYYIAYYDDSAQRLIVNANSAINDSASNTTETWSSLKIQSEIDLKTEINDAATSTTETWSSNKIEDRVQKALVPLNAVSSFPSFEQFSVTLNYITVLGDLSNYFFVVNFNSSGNASATLTVNALSPIPIITKNLNGVDGVSEEINADVRYLSYYDGTSFVVITDLFNSIKPFGPNESIKITNDGGSLRALMSYINASDGDDFFGFAAGPSSASWPNHFKIFPPTATHSKGAIGYYDGANHVFFSMPTGITDAFTSNALVTNNSFYDNFPPSLVQNLTDSGAATGTTDINLKDGYNGYWIMHSSATDRTIDFITDGAGADDVEIANGYIHLFNTNAVNLTIHLNGANTNVATLSGSNPEVLPSSPFANHYLQYTLYNRAGNTLLNIEIKRFT